MRVILLQNIKGLGRISDVKSVSDGYGRNYLLAKNLAKLATENTLKEVEALKKKAEMTTRLGKERAVETAEKIKDLILEFVKRANKTGKLFASLTQEEIAERLSETIGAKVEPDMIDLKEHGEHIKQAGEHMIEVELVPGIKAELKIVVKG